jgi:hypothetical protein
VRPLCHSPISAADADGESIQKLIAKQRLDLDIEETAASPIPRGRLMSVNNRI